MADRNSKNGFKESVWKIRDYIQELEDIKDDIIEYLGPDNNMWITDAKEFYYCTVSAWEMLRAATGGKEKYLESSKNFLNMAKSRLGQSMSELEALSKNKGKLLKKRAIAAFEKCWDAFSVEFETLTREKEDQGPIEIVIKISDTEYHIPCSVCGKISAVFKTGMGRFDKEESLIFSGITIGKSFDIKRSEEIFKVLDKKSLHEAHKFMEKYHEYEGLDAYCPKCDKVYCLTHYNIEEEWDEGFYDCTYGTCPAGHKRIIND